MLEVKNLDKTFVSGVMTKRYTHAVKNVSFAVEEGKTLGIVGNSGSGKSTLARILVRLEKADSGEVRLDGTDILSPDKKQVKTMAGIIQMVFQHPEHSLDPFKTIHYSLAEPFRIHHICPKNEIDDRIAELLKKVGLGTGLFQRYPHQISGGEAQRIMIAKALILNPRVLILDEPTSMLDVSIQAQVMNLFLDLQKELNLSYLFISHDIQVVSWLCENIAIMNDGAFVETGKTSEVLNRPQHSFTKELLDNLILT